MIASNITSTRLSDDTHSCRIRHFCLIHLIKELFLSADLDAIGDAMNLGIDGAKALLFMKDGKGSAGAWASLSRSTSAYRRSREKGMDFKDEDRQHPDDPQKKKKKK